MQADTDIAIYNGFVAINEPVSIRNWSAFVMIRKYPPALIRLFRPISMLGVFYSLQRIIIVANALAAAGVSLLA